MMDFSCAHHFYDMIHCVLIVKTMGEKMYFYDAPSSKSLKNLGYKRIGKCDGFFLYRNSNGEKRCVRGEVMETKIESIIEIEMLWDETGTSTSYYTVYINNDLGNTTWSSYNLKQATDAEIQSILKNIGSGIFKEKMEIEILEQFIQDVIYDGVRIETILDGLQSRKDLLSVAIDFMYKCGYIKTPRNRL